MTTKSIARRHHYIPQAYLAAFTSTGAKGGQFYGLHVGNGHAFRTTALNVGALRDFNRVDVEGQPPDAIERALAPIEGQAVEAIRRVIDSETFPSDGDWNLILNLLCLIAVRNPKMRGVFNDARELMLRRLAELLVSEEKVWNHHLTKARDACESIAEPVSFDQVKQFVEAKRYSIEFHPEGNLRVEFEAFNELLPMLGKRTWSVLVAPEGGPEFICSDHPVSVTWKSGHSGPIGFGHKQTEVFMPLGRRVGFYGVYESPLKQVINCKPHHVAMMKRRTVWNAEMHVYSAQQNFFVLDEGNIREVWCRL